MNRIVLALAGVIALAIISITFVNKDSAEILADGPVALVNVRVPELGALALQGKSVFDENCAACHGENGAGVADAGPTLVHKIYEPSHHADIAFFLAAKNGVRAHHWQFGNMPPVETISEQQVAQIVTYIRTLQVANGIN